MRCARLHVPNRLVEHDALIAATAFVHRMTVVIKKVVDFTAKKAPLIDPWSGQASGKTGG